LQESGKLPTGAEVSILTGQYRARLGAGRRCGRCALGAGRPRPDDENPSEAVLELAREYRALVESLLEIRGASGAIQFLREARAPGHLADLSGYSPTSA